MSEHVDSNMSLSASEERSDVPTELLSPSQNELVVEYMSRRQYFLSDYERYNPVQNMRMLANHVFDLSENIIRLRRDFEASRRLLGIVSDGQHELNESNKGLGYGLEAVSKDAVRIEHEIKNEIGGLENEVRNGLGGLNSQVGAVRDQFKNDIGGLNSQVGAVRDQFKNDIGGLENEVRNELGGLRYQVTTDLGGLSHQVKNDLGGFGHYVKNELGGFGHQVKNDLGGVQEDLSVLRSEVQSIHQTTQHSINETQQGIEELKQMLTMILNVRA